MESMESFAGLDFLSSFDYCLNDQFSPIASPISSNDASFLSATSTSGSITSGSTTSGSATSSSTTSPNADNPSPVSSLMTSQDVMDHLLALEKLVSSPDKSTSSSNVSDSSLNDVTTPPPKDKRTGRPEDKRNGRPDFSYVGLIARALIESPSQKLLLCDIYKFISDNYPYYKDDDRSWKNSIRHNLSLNECFIKAGRAEIGKGNYWSVHPAFVDDFRNGNYKRTRMRRRAQRFAVYANATVFNSQNVATAAPSSNMSGAGVASADRTFAQSAPSYGSATIHCARKTGVEALPPQYASYFSQCYPYQNAFCSSANATNSNSNHNGFNNGQAMTPPPQFSADYFSRPAAKLNEYCTMVTSSPSTSLQYGQFDARYPLNSTPCRQNTPSSVSAYFPPNITVAQNGAFGYYANNEFPNPSG